MESFGSITAYILRIWYFPTHWSGYTSAAMKHNTHLTCRHQRGHDAALHTVDGVTQMVDIFPMVGGQEDGHAGGGFFLEEGPHFLHTGLIQAVEGLFDDDAHGRPCLPQAAGEENFSLVLVSQTADAFHQHRFAGAVPAHQAVNFPLF